LGLLLRLRLRPGPRCTRRRGAGFGAALRRPAFVLPAAFDLLALGVDATTAATTTTLARCALSVGAGDFSRSGGSRRGGCRRRWRRHVPGGRIIGRGHVRTRLARLARTALGPTLGAAARSAGTAATLATAAAAAGIHGGPLLARLAEDLAHARAGCGLRLHAFARLARQRGQELGAHRLRRDLLLDGGLDVGQADRVALAGKADRVALLAQARGAADAVDVVFGIERQVV